MKLTTLVSLSSLALTVLLTIGCGKEENKNPQVALPTTYPGTTIAVPKVPTTPDLGGWTDPANGGAMPDGQRNLKIPQIPTGPTGVYPGGGFPGGSFPSPGGSFPSPGGLNFPHN